MLTFVAQYKDIVYWSTDSCGLRPQHGRVSLTLLSEDLLCDNLQINQQCQDDYVGGEYLKDFWQSHWLIMTSLEHHTQGDEALYVKVMFERRSVLQ